MSDRLRSRVDLKLKHYAEDHTKIQQDRNQEDQLNEGGYFNRQICELVQNAADEMDEGPGQIEILLLEDQDGSATLYCANQGRPLSEEAAEDMTYSSVSNKKATSIGRFGLGIRSYLRIADEITFWTPNLAFTFSEKYQTNLMQKRLPDYGNAFPAMTLPRVENSRHVCRGDENIAKFDANFATVVRLKLKSDVTGEIKKQMKEFPAEFLLFCRHVTSLTFRARHLGHEEERPRVIGCTVLEVEGRPEKGEARLLRLTDSGFRLDSARELANDREFLVLQSKCQVSEAALNEATDLKSRMREKYRESIPVSAAISKAGFQQGRGRLWTFFPTNEQTGLSCILNAPFQVNNDRTKVVDNLQLNRELLRAGTNLVCSNLAFLDQALSLGPLQTLDLLPSPDSQSGTSQYEQDIIEAAYRSASAASWLKATDGVCRTPGELSFPFIGKFTGATKTDLATGGAAKEWAKSASKNPEWIHPDYLSGNDVQRAKLKKLATDSNRIRSAADWVLSLRQDLEGREPYDCRPIYAGMIHAVVRCAEDEVSNCLAKKADAPKSRREILRRYEVIYTKSEEWVAPIKGSVFLPPNEPSETEVDLLYPDMTVHPWVMEDESVVRALRSAPFGLSDWTIEVQALATLPKNSYAGDWESWWNRNGVHLDGIKFRNAHETLEGGVGADPMWLLLKRILVQTMAGKWRPAAGVLLEPLPGGDPDPCECELVVDPDYHAAHLDFLTKLGCMGEIAPGSSKSSHAIPEWESETYRTNYGSQYKAQEWLPGFAGFGPKEWSPYFRGKLTAQLLTPGSTPTEIVLQSKVTKNAETTVRDTTVRQNFLRHYAVLLDPVDRQPLVPKQWLVGTRYSDLGTYWAWTDSEEMAEFLGVPWEPDSKLIHSILDDLSEKTNATGGHLPPGVSVKVPGSLYGRLAELGEPCPKKLLARSQGGLWISTDPLEVVLYGKLHEKVTSNQLILSDTEWRKAILSKWGVRKGDDQTGEAGGGYKLVDKPPRPIWDACDKQKLWEVFGIPPGTEVPEQFYDLLNVEVGVPKKGPSIDVWNRASQEYEQGEYASHTDKAGHLRLWVAESTALDVLVDSIVQDGNLDETCHPDVRRDFRKWWREITAPPPLDVNATDAEKIAQLIGRDKGARDILRAGLQEVGGRDDRQQTNRWETILKLWPVVDDIWKAAEEDPEGARLDAVQQVLHYHADATLSILKGLMPSAPKQWAGGGKAREFCRRHGLDEKYAGVRKSGREAELRIDPPPYPWPPLHDFQEDIVQRTQAVLLGSLTTPTGPRAMVSLPTGSGKTRVAIESVIRAFAQAEKSPAAPLIWIAPSDELCEQAIQAAHACWRGLNPRLGLVLNRLWSSNTIEPLKDEDRLAYFQFVVATPEKLNRVLPNMGDTEHTNSWLARPAAVVVDEAHYSISAEYTDILRRLGIEHGQVTVTPLIGLSATAYRQDADDALWLANRYGGMKLTVPGFEGDSEGLYRSLQDRGILARAEHEELPGLTDHTLPQSVAAELGTATSHPQQAYRVENELNRYLDRNRTRLDAILERCLQFDVDWPVVVFAPSVCSAEVLAARLNEAGRPARAVSGETGQGYRRQAIKDFTTGSLRFLVNYGVLSAGFDAPKARAIVIGRYVQSPVTYFQIIGRGLRGPLNGGTDWCRIVNVKDTFQNFRDSLAYTHFDWIWEAHR